MISIKSLLQKVWRVGSLDIPTEIAQYLENVACTYVNCLAHKDGSGLTLAERGECARYMKAYARITLQAANRRRIDPNDQAIADKIDEAWRQLAPSNRMNPLRLLRHGRNRP